jgi:molybdopterin converting factor small subunit
MMQIEIMSFGQLAEITGAAAFFAEASDSEQLKLVLAERFPALKDRKYALAVNKQLITSTTILKENDIVALLPPFSGG